MIDPLAQVVTVELARDYGQWIFCAASILFTLLHTAAEVFGGSEPLTYAREPFWRYFARHFGFKPIRDLAGYVLFAGLALSLTGLAIGGYLGGSQFFLGALIGARLGDSLLSHVGLRLRFEGENPGLLTSVPYLAEAGIVLLLAWGGELRVSGPGVAVGFGVFALFWLVSFALLISRRS